jgi:anti-anti-sigma regulatory factor
VLRELRKAVDLRPLCISLPETVSADALEAAMALCAPASALTANDVVIFDMNAVIKVDFTAASMLTPVITSIAHRYGVLSSFVNMRRKVARELERLGALRPVFSYVIGSPEPSPAGLGQWADIFPMHAFRPDQLSEIRSLAEAGCRRILGTHTPWLSATSRLPMVPKPVSYELRATLVRSLLRLVDELVQNVAMHSHGRGYLMIELDPNCGLSVYVGDSGVGLAKELAKRYTLPISNDLSALRYAFDLKHHRDKRRPIAGFRFGGRGLENVRQILSELRGEIKIRSGTAVAVYSPYKNQLPLQCSGRRYPIQGTHYNVFIPTPSKSQPPSE